MKDVKKISVSTVGTIIRERLSKLGISQMELSARTGEHFQTISAIIRGRREIPIPLSIKMDEALGYNPGTIAQAQTNYLVEKELVGRKTKTVIDRRNDILARIKKNGGLWSYSDIPEKMEDDSIIEAALIHLDLEDMHLIEQIWSKSHIKRVWKERLVRQGKRMNILNYILAVKLFNINNPDKYLKRYAKERRY